VRNVVHPIKEAGREWTILIAELLILVKASRIVKIYISQHTHVRITIASISPTVLLPGEYCFVKLFFVHIGFTATK